MQLASRYSWPKVARRFVREYEDLLGWREREIFGVRIRPMSRKRALSEIDRAFAAGTAQRELRKRTHSQHGCADDRFRAALQNFLVLNDGLGGRHRQPLQIWDGRSSANLNGTDFVPDFLASTHHRLRIYLVGTSDAAVAKAAERLRVRYPRHTMVGGRNGFFAGPEDIEETCRNYPRRAGRLRARRHGKSAAGALDRRVRRQDRGKASVRGRRFIRFRGGQPYAGRQSGYADCAANGSIDCCRSPGGWPAATSLAISGSCSEFSSKLDRFSLSPITAQLGRR